MNRSRFLAASVAPSPCSRKRTVTPMPRLRFSLLLLAVVALLAGCAQAAAQSTQPLYDAKTLPSGPLGDSIALGRAIVVNTQKTVPHDVAADMSCSACHVAGGTVARGGSLAGVYARFGIHQQRDDRGRLVHRVSFTPRSDGSAASENRFVRCRASVRFARRRARADPLWAEMLDVSPGERSGHSWCVSAFVGRDVVQQWRRHVETGEYDRLRSL